MKSNYLIFGGGGGHEAMVWAKSVARGLVAHFNAWEYRDCPSSFGRSP